MTIKEISGVVGFGGEAEMEAGPVTQALFRLCARERTGPRRGHWPVPPRPRKG